MTKSRGKSGHGPTPTPIPTSTSTSTSPPTATGTSAMKTRRRRSTPSRESSAAVSAATATLMSSRSGGSAGGPRSVTAGGVAGVDSGTSSAVVASSNVASSVGGGRESRSKSRMHGGHAALQSHAGHGHSHGHGQVDAAASPAAAADDRSAPHGRMAPSKKSRQATAHDALSHNPSLSPKSSPTRPRPSKTPCPSKTPGPSNTPARPLVLLGDKPRGLYECDYCRADLTRAPRIRCATCPDFDLCLDCFATADHERIGREKRAWVDGKLELSGGRGGVADNDLGTYVDGEWISFFRHRPDHGYVVADSARFALFPSSRSVCAVPVAAQSECEGEGESEGEGEREGEGVTCGSVAGISKAGDEQDMSREISAGKATSTEPRHSKDRAIPSDEDAVPKDGNDGEDDDDLPDPKPAPQPKFEYHLLHEPKQSSNRWTAEEDLRLLDAILTCGLGNWPDIAEHVSGGGGGGDGTGAGGEGTAPSSSAGATGSTSSALGVKTEKKCMERYLDDFLGRYGHILPPYTLVPVPVEDSSDGNVDANDDDGQGTDTAAIPTDRKRRRRPSNDDDIDDDVDDATSSTRKKQNYRILPTEHLEGYDALWPNPYIPPNTGSKRGDPVGRDLWYKSEQDYIKTLSKAGSRIDAEQIKAEFLERRAKNIAGYEAKVLPPRMEDIRTMPGCELAGYMPRRGDFDMEWDNDAEKMIADMEFSPDDSPEDQELKLEVIRIFNTKLDERERRKKFILDWNLLNYREHQAKMWALPPDERHLVHRMRMFARFHAREEHEALVQKILEAKRLRKEIAKLQMYRRMGIRSLADAEKFELDKVRREYHIAEWRKKEAEKKKADADAARAAKENAEGASVLKSGGSGAEMILGTGANRSMAIWKQYQADDSVRKSKRKLDCQNVNASEADTTSPEKSMQTQNSTVAADFGVQSKSSQKFVIKDNPGYELLSSKEVALCKRLQLLPRDYLSVKKVLILEALSGGLYNPKLSKSKGTLATIDIDQRENVIDFVMKAGWIPSRPTFTD
ncbi:hypothetical protein ACHAXS_005675 [Conticribra weissflogii]